MLVAAYTLLYRAHVSIDIIYLRFSARVRGILDIFTHMVFFFPFCIIVFYQGVIFAQTSWAQHETSASATLPFERDMSAEFVTIGMFAGLLIGLFMGHPLAFVLGGLAVIFGYLGWGTGAFYMFLNRTWGVMDSYILVAIPLFIFMAQLLDQSGVAEDLFDTMRYLFGPIRGGVAIAIVVVAR